MKKVLNQIEDVRLKNNSNTINILRLSFLHSPDKSKKILLKVNEWDNKISLLLEELTFDNHRSYEIILNDLERLRAENNKWWMQMIEIATKYEPHKTEKLINNTTKFNSQSSNLFKKL